MTITAPMVTRAPLSYPLYRAVWICTLIANISVWMQNVGSAWMMTSLTPSPLMVALIQTATTLPAFLFGLPGGVFADQFDRRRLLIWTHGWMLSISFLLCLLVWLDLVTPVVLLLTTFALGIGSMLSIPAGQASTSDAVPHEALLPAIALNGVAYNAARAVGPALAATVIAGLGSGAVFIINTMLFMTVIIIYTFWYKPPDKLMPPQEGMFSAIRSGVRYVYHSRDLRGNIFRTVLFVSCASALWALLPLVAKQRPEFGARGYGVLLASMGAGAVAAGILLGRLRERFSLNKTTSVACMLFSLAMLVAAHVSHIATVCIALTLGGAAWVSFTSIIGAAVQTSLPPWVRARGLAVYLLIFQGSMALGAIVWGLLASSIGVPLTLTAASCLVMAGLWFVFRIPVRMGEDKDVTPYLPWAELNVISDLVPDGLVSIQIGYMVLPQQSNTFRQNAYRLGTMRRRNGAYGWSLFCDLADQDQFIERFIFASWDEYLHQQTRTTVADRSIEDDLLQFLQPGSKPWIKHYICHPSRRAA